MQTKGQYILMNMAEFAEWLANHQFSRTILRIQNHHTWKPTYSQFKGNNHFAMLEAMYNYHVNENGWNNIGQNLTSFPDGLIAVCRPFENTPACIYKANSGGICIEHIGNFDKGGDQMTQAHRECIIRTNALLCKEFNLQPNTDSIVYHHWYDLDTGERDNGTGNNKSCPGTAFFGGNKVADCEANLIPLVLSDLAVIQGGGGSAPLVALRKGRVASSDGVLSIRSGPGAGNSKLGELKNGDVVEVFENNGAWCRIDSKASKWVNGSYLLPIELDTPNEASIVPAGHGGKLAFNLPKPSTADLGTEYELWGTYYYGQPAKEAAGGIALRNKNDNVVGPRISQRDWCLGAMEGTVVVTRTDGTVETFNYEAKGSSAETSCGVYFPNLNPAILAGTERVRWRRAKGPYGDGAASYILAPYRTLAVDKNIIPLGTALYIEAARGTTITLPDGSKATHDGYFFAADVGGAIKGNHVDVFLGTSTKNPFSFVGSSANKTFKAKKVKASATIASLKAMHTA